jgi:hypothetical protein
MQPKRERRRRRTMGRWGFAGFAALVLPAMATAATVLGNGPLEASETGPLVSMGAGLWGLAVFGRPRR